MGCLSRVGCLVVLAGAGVVGWWLYGDRLPSELSTAVGRGAHKVRDVAGAVADRTSGTRSATRDSTAAESAGPANGSIAWATVGTATAQRGDPLAPLSRADGPAYVSLGAGELASWIAASLPAQLPRSASNLQVALDRDQLLVRAAIDATEIAGDGTLGKLLGTALRGRDSLQFAGSLEPLSPGKAQYHVEALRVKGFDVPSRLIPTFMNSLRRGPRPSGLADDAFALPLPRTVADLRVVNGRLTFYKAVPTP